MRGIRWRDAKASGGSGARGEERRVTPFQQCRSSLAILERNRRDAPAAEITLKRGLGADDDSPARRQIINAWKAAQTARPSFVVEANRQGQVAKGGTQPPQRDHELTGRARRRNMSGRCSVNGLYSHHGGCDLDRSTQK